MKVIDFAGAGLFALYQKAIRRPDMGLLARVLLCQARRPYLLRMHTFQRYWRGTGFQVRMSLLPGRQDRSGVHQKCLLESDVETPERRA